MAINYGVADSFRREVIAPERSMSRNGGIRLDPDREFAPYTGPRVCQSGTTGRWRPKHWADKDGRCIFCGAQE